MIDHQFIFVDSGAYECAIQVGSQIGQNQVLPTKNMWQHLFPTLSSIAMGAYDTGNL